MRVVCTMAGILAVAGSSRSAGAQPREPAGQLVREVVYNELRDHDAHGYWRYWIEQHVQKDTRLEEQVETTDGPLARTVQTNGRPVDAQTRDEEQAKLDRLVNSPVRRSLHRKAYTEDEKHVALIVTLLPDAFVFDYAGDENGCHHLRYRPSPTYFPRSLEGRIIHSMSGDLWIDARNKRLARLEGHMDDNVDFGFGLLGRVDKGSWFRIRRIQVSSTEWKMDQLEMHMSGHALLLKTIGRETSEVRGGFVAVPSSTDMAQGMRILDQTDPKSPPNTMARISPVSFRKKR